jgi:DDE family transposase
MIPILSIAPHRFSAGKEGCSRPLQSRQERGGFGRRGCSGEDRLLVGLQHGKPGRKILRMIGAGSSAIRKSAQRKAAPSSATYPDRFFELPALTIAQLYKCRWQVELFFKWIKQHLRIKAFFGTNDNAVKTQIWIAIGVYVLVAIIKKRLCVEASLSTIPQILSLMLFEKTPMDQLL